MIATILFAKGNNHSCKYFKSTLAIELTLGIVVVEWNGNKWVKVESPTTRRRTMLLTGTHPRTLDDKKRLTLPKRIREQVGEVSQLFVTPGSDQSLWVFTKDELERFSGQLDQTPATDAQARVFRLLFYAQMEGVELDRTGRILIPDRLVQFAGLEHEVVLLGVRDHLELWDTKRWDAYFAQHSPEFDKAADQAFRGKGPM